MTNRAAPSSLRKASLRAKAGSTYPRVALVGRTNVGKSTLWNRLTDTSRALVSDEAHTTRDRNFGIVYWKGAAFEVVDTGGMDVEKTEIGRGITAQAERAIAEADLVLFIADVQTGIVEDDRKLARRVKKLNPNVWLLANKTDKPKMIGQAQEPAFFQLGLGAPIAISAATSIGIGDLLDAISAELERLGKPPIAVEEAEPLRIALIGRPNVGKSSLTNAILGEDRVIVSATAHTTREPQDTWFKYKDRDLVLVDTAGMRRKAHVEKGIEESGIDRNLESIKQADIAFLVFDASERPTGQDRHLAGFLEDASKGLILVANKWDLVENKQPMSTNEYERLLRYSLPFLAWAPIVFVSALKKQRTGQLLDMALTVQEERHRTIDYNALNRLLKSCIKTMNPLASYGPKSPRIYDVAQVGEAPPTFLMTIHGEKEGVHQNWVRFFEKRLREKFGFTGTPVVVKVQNIPVSKSLRKRNVHGPGMEAVAGKIVDRRTVNMTMRRQKGR